MDTIFATGNFPTHLGYEGDTTEVMHIYRRFESSGYPERAIIMLAGGRDTFPEYPTKNWSPVFYNNVYQVIKNNTSRMMDSVNGIINIENLFLDNTELEGFDPGITDYVVELNENDTIGPIISLVSDNAIVSVDYPSFLPGYAKVTALSMDKTNGATYSFYYSKDSAYWDTGLELILINYKDTVPLEPEVREYNMQLQPGSAKVSSVIVHSKVQGQAIIKTIPSTLPGDIEIEVTAVDKVTKASYIIHVSPPTGIDDAVCPDREKISLINPVRDKLLLLNKCDRSLDSDIALFDLSGRLLCSTSMKQLSRGISEVNVDMSSMQAGIYIYSIMLGKDNISGKLVKM